MYGIYIDDMGCMLMIQPCGLLSDQKLEQALPKYTCWIC